jgi:hypothetical protein
MKKRLTCKLRIENLEERKLTAAVTWQLGSLGTLQGGTALVGQQTSGSQSSLSYGSFRASGFNPGIGLNHNETLVCPR